jgi:hypothetical protein
MARKANSAKKLRGECCAAQGEVNRSAVRSKSARQRAQFAAVKSGIISSQEAVERARLIPKALIASAKVIRWPSL